ncbi:MAG: hypothetical protein ASARMPREDX12_003282 [Alectoria sarmentosa]|nr:MAG: hypothetical protein ASARMPREDX12_003282 [Alectoria sarmentosa]
MDVVPQRYVRPARFLITDVATFYDVRDALSKIWRQCLYGPPERQVGYAVTGLTNETLQSNEVCPACATKIFNLTERAQGRRAARREGRLVDEMDDDVAGNQHAMDAWSAKQKVLQERVDVFLFMLETGMVDEWLRQMGRSRQLNILIDVNSAIVTLLELCFLLNNRILLDKTYK